MANESPGKTIWSESPNQETRSVGFYLVMFFMLVVIGFIAGAFGSISFSVDNPDAWISVGSGVNYFWPGITIQQVGGIWFGAWGILAGVIFPFFSNAVTGTPFVISFAYLPANFLQSFLPAFAFRRLKLDPRLESGADYLSLLFSMFLGNLLGSFWSVFVLIYLTERIAWGDAASYFFGWFGGNMIAGVLFNFVILKSLSQLVIRANGLVKKWWS